MKQNLKDLTSIEIKDWILENIKFIADYKIFAQKVNKYIKAEN